MDVQGQMRENTLDLNGRVETEEKEKKFESPGASEEDRNLATSASRLQTGEPNGSVIDDNESKTYEGGSQGIPTKTAKRQAGSTAASHLQTHGPLWNKWDAFDVDAALKEIDDGNENEQPFKKVPKTDPPSPFRPQSKTSKDNGSGEIHEGNFVAEGQEVSSMVSGDMLPGSSEFDDVTQDAASEKDLGNEYFKEAKYVRAIECYSRSIAMQPTAVAYANRAMASIKIQRFDTAELDCSEALSLDDQYTKAYSRRGTARKELKKYLGAVEDFAHALQLEPDNKELKRQYAEVEELYHQEAASIRREEMKENIRQPLRPIPTRPRVVFEDIARNNFSPSDVSMQQPFNADSAGVIERRHAEAAAATQAAVKRAAGSAVAAVSRNVVAPKSACEFELMWKGFGGNQVLQVRLLKVMDPFSLPKVFKDALSAPLLLEIIQTLENLFPEEAVLGVQILENLTKVGRFGMTVMFLSSTDKTGLRQLWDRVLVLSPHEVQTHLQALRAVYRLV